ncbi:MAG TPA: hypothetical protein VNL18_12905, partial [Gemmatimonadales bacterium]|nr:hypothetical protein [Gemmatimonadales bacterium]
MPPFFAFFFARAAGRFVFFAFRAGFFFALAARFLAAFFFGLGLAFAAGFGDAAGRSAGAAAGAGVGVDQIGAGSGGFTGGVS